MSKKILAVLLSLVAVFASVTFAFADPASVVVGGDFQFQYTAKDGKVTDTTGNPLWWELQATSYKNFSDYSQAYLQVKATADTSVPFVSGFGYSYKVNDGLSFTVRNDAAGEYLTDSQLMANGCDWRDLSKNVNFNNKLFAEKTEVKMDAVPFRGFNLTVAYSPEGDTRLSNYDPLPEQYLIKGKYTADTFNVGFGYTNTHDGYTEGTNTGYKAQNPNRPVYGVYGEIFPDANQKYYWEYVDGGAYLAKATLTFDPYTLKATYGNDVWYQKVGQKNYLPNTLDCELDYALSDTKTLIGGLAAYLGTEHDGIANAMAGITIGRLTAEVSYDFGGVIIPAMGVDGKASTSIIGKYNLDGTNSLVADYNLDKQILNAKLYIRFW